MTAGRHIEIRGVVQGVGFRPWVYRLAREAGLTGSVTNDRTGVVIDAFAPTEDALDGFVARLCDELPPAARIDRLTSTPNEARAPRSFEIAPSVAAGAAAPSIPADLATCDACLREIDDPANRRHRYAFTSCTHCGPRFTIALEVPYDRATTTMASFPMCEDCRREYDDPNDRRFHAQPNACPRCGPVLGLVDAAGRTISGVEGPDAVARAAVLLRRGAVVAIKGLGGFHLACDATNTESVQELRRRKRRDEKPFAVMVRDAGTAERLAVVTAAERAVLTSPSHPIVLLQRRPGESPVVAAVAPGSRRVGVMLPYTPLHHVLLGDVSRPLVMTSGNASDEPIATEDHDALVRLAGIADAFLVHDRAVASRADDSVAVVAHGRPLLLRRSRGFVPARIALPRSLEQPILSCGAHLKNTFCLGTGDGAYLGPHIGDLDNLLAYAGFERAIERLETFLGVRAEVVAHDLHPDYLSTRYALERPGARCFAVQHHHAHVASCMVEHGLEGPVLGVAFDGTGLGMDGTLWGGEFLIADYRGFERVAALRGVRLSGGERAIRDVYRVALALLDDAFDGQPPLERLALFDAISPAEIAVVRKMIAAELNAPISSGAGRYFDAFGALGLARPRAAFEGQIATAWEQAAATTEAPPYEFALDAEGALTRVDLRPAVRGATEDLIAKRPVTEIAARFHETLVDATAETVRRIARTRGPLPVVLTGGCFQNVRLSEGLARALGRDHRVFVHGEVPPGDGGIALGQLAVANALYRTGASQGGLPCVSAFPAR